MHPEDQLNEKIGARLNWLRAGVLGANDGIVSIASIVVGVSAAEVSHGALVATGVAGIVAGAFSMAAGEYVSVSTQRDSERALLARERGELRDDPDGELIELTALIEEQGLEHDLAQEAAIHMSERDALRAHARYELGVDPDQLTDPWAAAFSSLVSFAAGAIIPFTAIVLAPNNLAVAITMAATALALAITGSVSAWLGRAPIAPATLRNILGGIVAMAVTYVVGSFIGS